MCVLWNFEGVIHWEFVPNGHAVDVDLYSQQLERVHEILRRRYPALFDRNRVLLQQDNMRTTMTKIQELEGIELLHIHHTVLILHLQIAICFDPWPISCVKKFRKL